MLCLGIAMELALVGILAIGKLADAIPLFLLLYFCAFSIYVIAVYFGYSSPGKQRGDQEFVLLIVGFAILFRATLFLSDPSLSDDIYRYFWDGRLVVEGINPYGHVPGSNELVGLRDSHYGRINHKDIGTPYGPLTILCFSLTRYVTDSVLFMKIPFILFDCLSIIVIIRLLALSGLSKNNLIVYAWNPLVLIEISGSGHNDSLGIFFLLLAIYYLQHGKQVGASIGLACAIMSKYFSLLSMPVFLKYLPKRDWMIIALILLAGYLPFAAHVETHFLNILKVGSLWRFNDSLFSLLLFATQSLLLTKVLVIVAMVILGILVWRRPWPPVRGLAIMIGGAILLTTTVQPWYLVWMVPFLCFSLNRAWLLLTGLVMLSYHVLIRYEAEGIWSENLWIRLAIYVPFYCLLLGDAVKALQARYASSVNT